MYLPVAFRIENCKCSQIVADNEFNFDVLVYHRPVTIAALEQQQLNLALQFSNENEYLLT